MEDANFMRYQLDDSQQQRCTVYNIMASLEAAQRVGDRTKYDYLMKIIQQINEWHLTNDSKSQGRNACE